MERCSVRLKRQTKTPWWRPQGDGNQLSARINAKTQEMEEDTGPRTPQDAEAPASLFLSLLQAMQRPGRGPAFPFQPQRFGRNTQGSRSNERLSTRAEEGLSSPFWSLAAPQRFGKK
ncbi:pro-FMRFamide-related neuropeptide FF isoform X3 [Eptesicus fuscus]|nr:pro-FMRFamide-related neuropeptide FF isoform X3 [Eptesicus fuscus]XP_054574978.1 pro-FMRFamide-related neuropeptide FF isoform X3 [Eptesicus fuscus]